LVDQPLKVPPSPLWRRPAPVDPFTAFERRRRRLRLIVICTVAAALVAEGIVAWVVTNARANYLAGEKALDAGDYGLAMRRLGAAKMIFWPYAGARGLLSDAVALSNGQTQLLATLQRPQPPSAQTRALRRAAALFQAGDYAAARAQVGALPSRVPLAVGRALATRSNPAVAALLLLAGADQAFAAGDWSVAARDAAVVLVPYPRCGPAAALAAAADRRVRAEPLVLRAAALVAAGRWSAARTVVRHALRIDRAYPGAATMLARINATLAHRKAVAKAKAAAKAAAAQAAAQATAPSTPTAPPTRSTPPPP
jgi:hypothetical protein